jgi:sugar phosphate isomerase/epimerase
MRTEKLAVQMYTLRDFVGTTKEFAATCKKVSDIGYRAVQMSGIGAMDKELSAAEARTILDDHGLKVVATHRPWDALLNLTGEEIEFHHSLGCDYAAIGGLWKPYDQDAASYRRFVQEAQSVIAELAKAGIRFGYHNHSHEFQKIGEGRKTLYDILVFEAPASLMLEVDTHWVAHAGASPVLLLKRCAGRIPVVHLKDTEVIAGEGPVMCAVGEGNLDWIGILRACEKGRTEWYAVEQDTCRRDPFDCLRSSFDFLGETLEALAEPANPI